MVLSAFCIAIATCISIATCNILHFNITFLAAGTALDSAIHALAIVLQNPSSADAAARLAGLPDQLAELGVGRWATSVLHRGSKPGDRLAATAGKNMVDVPGAMCLRVRVRVRMRVGSRVERVGRRVFAGGALDALFAAAGIFRGCSVLAAWPLGVVTEVTEVACRSFFAAMLVKRTALAPLAKGVWQTALTWKAQGAGRVARILRGKCDRYMRISSGGQGHGG